MFRLWRTASETKLFPTVKKGKSTFADATGKWYARLLKTVGLKDQSLVLHGLRHTLPASQWSLNLREKDLGAFERLEIGYRLRCCWNLHPV